jgi:hypothetical protein
VVVAKLVPREAATDSATSVIVESTITDTPPPPSTTSAPTFPDASNTGVADDVTLTRYSGPLTISTAGTVIDGKLIDGCLTVAAGGVTIRNSRITCTGFYVVDIYPGRTPWLLIEDSEIDCQMSPGNGIGEEGVIVRRVEVTGCTNGFDVNQDFLVEDSYIHSPYNGGDAHADGAQLNGTDGTNITFRHNTILFPEGTSAIISHPNSRDVLIENNLLGGGGYTLYCPSPTTSNFRVLNNTFSTTVPPAFGYTTECQNATEFAGNRLDDGTPLDP